MPTIPPPNDPSRMGEMPKPSNKYGEYDSDLQMFKETAVPDLKKLDIDYDDVIETLEQEGVDKFVKSWDELTETVRDQLKGAK